MLQANTFSAVQSKSTCSDLVLILSFSYNFALPEAQSLGFNTFMYGLCFASRVITLHKDLFVYNYCKCEDLFHEQACNDVSCDTKSQYKFLMILIGEINAL